MSKKQVLIRGTFILTFTGFANRLMGFFYRIFLSRTFGAEGVGLYQLIFPVYALCYALTTAGIETAISRSVACKISLGKEKEAGHALRTGLILTFFPSCLCAIFLQQSASWIAVTFLNNIHCANLLTILSYTFPFSAIHSCICGYCYGKQQTKIPAISQLLEQFLRISSVFLMYFLLKQNGQTISIAIAVCGLVFGEMASACYCCLTLSAHRPKQFTELFDCMHGSTKRKHTRFSPVCFFSHTKELLTLSIPLTTNRVLINLLQSIEAISIPSHLQLYRFSSSEALRIYGVLNGMALPCILFPSAITHSISIMLMPAIAETQASGNQKELRYMIRKSIGACFILGIGCCIFFLLFGNFIGIQLFGNTTAGHFIVTLAWICPFLYTNSALLSILNGLGKTHSTLFINSIGLLIRIAGVFYGIPLLGIRGYLWGLLISQLTVSLLAGKTILHSPISKKVRGHINK